WALGRLFQKKNQRDQALQAYRQALEAVQSTRSNLLQSRYEVGRKFDESVGDLYKELTVLLLSEAADKSEEKRALLVEARDTLEKLRVVELEDYFRDQCVTDSLQQYRQDSDEPFKQTAVLHMLTTSQTVNILLTLPNGEIIPRHINVDGAQFRRQVELLRIELQDVASNQFFRLSQQIYNYLMKPLESQLSKHNITTLVIVPDDTLRLIPLSALHDGEQFLIERYVIAAIPALSLTSKQANPAVVSRALLGGLSESVQGFSALPHVKSELQQIRDIYQGDVLLDNKFDVNALEKTFVEDTYPIVHIASHGEFGSRPEQSFLLTYDGKITMNRLESLLKSRFQQPVELLTLSACQTALGDDMSALGLAGIAVKSGAKSALASLWQVNDKATAVLITQFYRQLKQPGIGKAQALQRAQQYMLTQNLYRHPTYWSAFLLIGHWQ
ncbi:MAG: CHAT domain-containing protein, partial [Pseudomonadota bacterium]